jgi:hypothetical protein
VVELDEMDSPENQIKLRKIEESKEEENGASAQQA